MSLDNTNPNLFCVYMHTNKVNSKRYIGITNQRPLYRWRTDGSGYKHQIFGRAINKYGWENFDHELLAVDVSKEEACELEQKYIQEYQTTNPKYGYNISKGGDSGTAGVYNKGCSRPIYQYDLEGNYINEWPSMDEVERQLGIVASNIGACSTGKTHSSGGFQWSRKKVANIGPVRRSLLLDERYGDGCNIFRYDGLDGKFIYKYSSILDAAISVKENGHDLAGIKCHISQCLNGTQFSAYGSRWFFEYQGEFASVERPPKRLRTVFQYTLNGEYVQCYKTPTEAAKAIGGDNMKIGACCNGKRGSASGFMWSFTYKGEKIPPHPYLNMIETRERNRKVAS